jgi:2-iminobutanoate/2-iminopropanoate deaminase
VAHGGLIFVAGQLGTDPASGEFAGEGVEAQAEQAMRNLGAVLEAAGSSLDEVVKTTIFLADMGDFSTVNEVYARHMSEPYPARSTVQVAGLPRNARVEIECIAAAGTES